MEISIGINGLVKIVNKQIDNFFGLSPQEREIIIDNIGETMNRVNYCFSRSSNKYYHRNGNVFFDPFHSGQYSIFLYFLSNTISRKGYDFNTLADKIYYLNKALNGLDVFHQVQMPDIFFVDHPVGSVIGRAVIGNFFSFAQNCTIGNNRGKYPTIGEHVRMTAHSAIIGKCDVGDYVIVGAGTIIKDVDVPPYSLVFGHPKTCVIKSYCPDNITPDPIFQ